MSAADRFRSSRHDRAAFLAIIAVALCALWPASVAAQDATSEPDETPTEASDEALIEDTSLENGAPEATARPADTTSTPTRETAGRLWLRFAGQFVGTSETDSQTVLVDGSVRVANPTTERLQPSLGGHVGFDVPVGTPYFHLGGMVGAVSWISDTGDDLQLGRNTWLDFDLTLRGQVEFVDGLLDLYLMVPVGLTVNVFSERTAEVEDVRWGHGPGFNVGAALGLAVDVGGDGVFVESGWTMRRFFHESRGELFGERVTFERDVTTHQWHVGAGFFFDL